MSRVRKSWMIQPDSRGRLQLPKTLRHYPLFEVQETESAILLFPLESRRVSLTKQDPWGPDQVSRFLEDSVKPDLGKHDWPAHVEAICLFGSRARGEGLDQSDFDWAFFLNGRLQWKEREKLSSEFEEKMSVHVEKLKTHQISGEHSFVYFPAHLSKSDPTPPALFVSVAKEGIVFYERRKGFFKSWRDQIQDRYRPKQVNEVWKWR